MTYVARRVGPSTAVAEPGSMSTSLRERPPPRPLAPRLPREGRRRSLTRRLSERPRRPDSLDPEAKDRVRQRPGQRQGETRTGTANRGDQEGTGQGQGRPEQRQDRPGQRQDRPGEGRDSQQGRPGRHRDRTDQDRQDRPGQGQGRSGQGMKQATEERREGQR